MLADCIAHSLRCDKCHRHAPTLHQPPEEMSSISYSYPFMKWSMDVLGPMEASGGMKRLKNLLVLTDYSTKWIEAKAFQQVTKKQVEDFLWENIVCQHGIPYEIVTDNGTNLTSGKIKAFCNKVTDRQKPPTKLYLTTSRKDLVPKNQCGPTTPRKSTQETPFSLTYGLEAVIPVETIVPSVTGRHGLHR